MAVLVNIECSDSSILESELVGAQIPSLLNMLLWRALMPYELGLSGPGSNRATCDMAEFPVGPRLVTRAASSCSAE